MQRSANWAVWSVTWLALMVTPNLPVLAADLDPKQVQEAIDRAVQYLFREQKQDGSWPPLLQRDVTGLVTLALLEAGIKPDEPHVKAALTHLRKPAQAPSATYQTALQTMVFCAAEPQKDLLLIRRNATWLEQQQISSGPNKGAWSYPSGAGDNSNSQFALLALHEAERAGVKIKDETWNMALEYWKRCQNPDGSFGYTEGNPGSGSMTCAGITSLVIAAGRLNRGDAQAQGNQVMCCGQQEENQHLERALGWLGQNFSVHNNVGGNGLWLLYYLYGVERVGRMTARRHIGGHDWYREGADMLVRHQDQLSGFWKGSGSVEDIPVIGTSLALLFMAKGRRPVLMSRLKFGPEADGDWNHHRSAMGNLTSYVESKWNRSLTWQVIDIEAARAGDLLQTPVLFISGRNRIKLTDQQAGDLREFINGGGFIFAEACCDNSDGFHHDFENLVSRVFPEPEYRLRELGPEHPVWLAEERVATEQLRPLWGVEYGCRTSVIYVPAHPAAGPGPALSCLWELASPGRDQKFSTAVSDQVAGARSIGINVLAYATNRELKSKDLVPTVAPRTSPHEGIERAKLYIAKLKHAGGWNVAPAALPNLQRALNKELGVLVGTDQREVTLAEQNLFNYHLVFMHGRHDFRLSDAERGQLRTYVDRGGMILADAVCASPAFDRAFRREMAAVFPDAPMERMAADHALFSTSYGGFDLATVSRRDPQRGEGRAEANLRKVQPELEGIKFADSYRVLYSPYDLSCALENHESLECKGYTREDAARIGINVVLYSLHE